MGKRNQREINRLKRHKRIRKKVFGTKQRPRFSVHRSNSNLYVQLIDDLEGRTLLSVSTRSGRFKEKLKYGGNQQAAALLGQILAEDSKSPGIREVVFDRGGYLYHGKVKALAESAREHGLKF